MQEILNILGSVGFNWHVALANFVNFLIILFILNKFFFGSLRKTMYERRLAIEKGLSQASDAEKALAHAEEEKNEIVHAAKKESHTIISEAQMQAEVLAATIKAAAKKEIEEKHEALRTEKANLLSTLEKEFSEKAPELVAKLYAETLRKNLTEKDNNALIASMKV